MAYAVRFTVNILRNRNIVYSQKLKALNKCFKPDNMCRRISTTQGLHHGEFEWEDPKSEDEVVNITYIDKNGKEYNVRGKVGDNAMYLAHRYGIEMEGACEASLACTTCHCYVLGKYGKSLPESTEKEDDLLDMAPFLKDNSRLGCQIILTKKLEGMKLQLPRATRNFYVDGHKPTPH